MSLFSLLFVNPNIYVYAYEFMAIYLIPQAIIQYYFISLVQMITAIDHLNHFQLALISCCHRPVNVDFGLLFLFFCFALFQHTLNLQHSSTPSSSFIVLESTIFQRIPGSIYQKMELETMICTLSVLIASWGYCFQALPSDRAVKYVSIVLESDIFQRISGSVYWKTELQTMICTLNELIANEVSLLLDPLI